MCEHSSHEDRIFNSVNEAKLQKSDQGSLREEVASPFNFLDPGNNLEHSEEEINKYLEEEHAGNYKNFEGEHSKASQETATTDNSGKNKREIEGSELIEEQFETIEKDEISNKRQKRSKRNISLKPRKKSKISENLSVMHNSTELNSPPICIKKEKLPKIEQSFLSHADNTHISKNLFTCIIRNFFSFCKNLEKKKTNSKEAEGYKIILRQYLIDHENLSKELDYKKNDFSSFGREYLAWLFSQHKYLKPAFYCYIEMIFLEYKNNLSGLGKLYNIFCCEKDHNEECQGKWCEFKNFLEESFINDENIKRVISVDLNRFLYFHDKLVENSKNLTREECQEQTQEQEQEYIDYLMA